MIGVPRISMRSGQASSGSLGTPSLIRLQEGCTVSYGMRAVWVLPCTTPEMVLPGARLIWARTDDLG